MRALIGFFLSRSLLVNVLLIGIFGLALASLSNTNRNAWPEVDLSTMQIITRYPGASPRDVEQNVTRLIEDELRGIVGIKKFTSVSAENVSTIIVKIDINHPDQDEVKDEVRRAVDRVSNLPAEVAEAPLVRDLLSTEFPIITVGISGEVPYEQLRQTAKLVERDLRTIRGVSKIDLYAYRDYEFQVDLDPDRLRDSYIALNDVLYAIDTRNVRATGGNLESYRTQRNILTLSQFESVEDVREVILRSAFGGGQVLLKDVGTVTEGFEDERMRTIFDGQRGISLVVKKTATADIIEVVDRINAYVAEKQGLLPEGLRISVANDASGPVRNRISVVGSNAIIGFVLVVIILIIFLDFRSSFLIALSIPTSFAITLIFLPLTDSDINVVSLAAMIIALGMIVDQSIVVSENALVYYRDQRTKREAILEGAYEVVVPVVASVLTTILAFGPMFAMSGTMGKFVFVIPVVVIASLLGSIFNGFFILPNHLRHALPDTAPQGEAQRSWQDRFFDRIAIPYRRILPEVLRHRYLAIAAALALLVFSLFWARAMMTVNLFPPDGAENFFIYVELPEEATLNATEEIVAEIEEEIRALPPEELRFYTAKIGTATSDELAQPVGGEENLAYLQVSLVPFSKRDRDAGDVMAELRERVLAREGILDRTRALRFELQKPGPPAGKPIELHVHGDRDADRLAVVNEVVAYLEAYPGVSDVTTNHKLGREEYKLVIDYEKLARTSLTVQDVASTLRIAFDGIRATSIVRNNEEVGIRVRFPIEHRQDVRNVLDLTVRNPQGNLVPIRAFARLDTTRAETAIHHTDGDVTTTIYGQTDIETPAQGVINRTVADFSETLRRYPDVRFSYGGEAEETQESMQSLLMAFVGGVIAIYLILVLLFDSLTQPLIVLLAIPFGLIGVIWAFYLHGRPFSFLGLIGVIGLSGIVVNNSLMMVEFINKIAQEKFRAAQMAVNELIPDVIEGASRRLRPIVITTITTVTGLMPTAYGIGGSDPFIEPMVLAIAWGLVLSTQISLILIPCFYLANLDLSTRLNSAWAWSLKRLEPFRERLLAQVRERLGWPRDESDSEQGAHESKKKARRKNSRY